MDDDREGRMRVGKPLLLAVDAGLLLYWTAVFLDLIPEEQRFRDYSNPIMQAWNWSFFPLDLSAALLGFLGVYLVRKGRAAGELVVTVGLTLTFCAGFMALSFWSYYGDFNLWWWLPNAALVLAPSSAFWKCRSARSAAGKPSGPCRQPLPALRLSQVSHGPRARGSSPPFRAGLPPFRSAHGRR